MAKIAFLQDLWHEGLGVMLLSAILKENGHKCEVFIGKKRKIVKSLKKIGAKKENLNAIIVGGSKIFNLKNNIIGEENIKSIKKELNYLNIKIVKENIGGSHGRIVKFFSHNFSVLIKITKCTSAATPVLYSHWNSMVVVMCQLGWHYGDLTADYGMEPFDLI